MIYNSYGLILAAHEPFESTEAAIEKESDIHSDSTVVKRTLEREKSGRYRCGKTSERTDRRSGSAPCSIQKWCDSRETVEM